jgi:hypothetical protein
MKCKCAFFFEGWKWVGHEELLRMKAKIKSPLMCHAGAVMEIKKKNILEKNLNQYLLLYISPYFILIFLLILFCTVSHSVSERGLFVTKGKN